MAKPAYRPNMSSEQAEIFEKLLQEAHQIIFGTQLDEPEEKDAEEVMTGETESEKDHQVDDHAPQASVPPGSSSRSLYQTFPQPPNLVFDYLYKN